MDRGHEFHGRVRIDQKVPRDSVMVSLSIANREKLQLPQSLNSWFIRHRLGGPNAVTRTLRDGTFRFRGLPSDFEGQIAFEYQFVLDPRGPLWSRAPGNHRVRVDAMIQEAQLDLLALPHRRCRLVYADDDSPVTPAELNIATRMEGDYGAPHVGVSVDDEGRFILIAYPSGERSLLRFRNPKDQPKFLSVDMDIRYSDTRRKRHLGAEELAGEGELLIRVPRVESLRHRFQIVDTAGAPIPRAVLMGKRLCKPTDAEGFGECLIVDGKPDTLRMAAKGYTFRRVPTPAPGAAWRFVLEKGNRLRIRARNGDGTVAEGQKLTVVYKESPFTNGTGGPTELHYALTPRERQGSLGGRSGATGLTWRYFILDDEGNCELFGLRESAPFRVELRDCMGTPVAGKDIVGLGRQEARTVTLEVTRPHVVIRAEVNDASGKPVSGARISVGFMPDHRGGYSYTGGNTDANGQVALGPLYSALSTLRASITKQGFVSRTIAPLEHTRLEIRLEPSIDVDVIVTDENGTAVQAQRATIGDCDSRERAPGCYRIAGVPRKTVDVRIVIGCSERIVRGDASTGTIRCTVPAVGSAVLEMAAADDGVTKKRIVLTSASGDGRPRQLDLRREKQGQPLTCELPALFPGRYRLQWPQAEGTLCEFEVRAGEHTRVAVRN
jgi:hypothetical protein